MALWAKNTAWVFLAGSTGQALHSPAGSTGRASNLGVSFLTLGAERREDTHILSSCQKRLQLLISKLKFWKLYIRAVVTVGFYLEFIDFIMFWQFWP